MYKFFFRKIENDDDYWNNKATVLDYHEKILREELKDEIICISNEELVSRAEEIIGLREFNMEIEKLNISDMFYSLESEIITGAICIGILGAITAHFTDLKGEKIEKYIDEVGQKYIGYDFDKFNPADSRSGYKHRYYFGHDPLRELIARYTKIIESQRLPEGFNLPTGEKVGDLGISLEELINKYYNRNSKIDILGRKIVLPFRKEMIAHYLKDFVTKDGLPIPFSSLFTVWEKTDNNFSQYKSKNKLMDTLGQKYGSVKFSDFSSIALMKMGLDFYKESIITRKSDRDKKAENLLTNQLYVICYGTCIIIQLFLIQSALILAPKSTKVIPGAKLNLILLKAFVYSSIEIIRSLNSNHKSIIDYYENSSFLFEGKNCENESSEKVMFIEYQSSIEEPYHFENSDFYCSIEKINYAFDTIANQKKNLERKDFEQLEAIYNLEKLRYQLGNNNISLDKYNSEVKTIVKSFFDIWGFGVFSSSNIHDDFYYELNRLYFDD